MINPETDYAVILGAGFSKCAGLPLMGELSAFLLSPSFNSELDQVVNAAISEFLGNCFYWREGDPLPSLEDIFTMIDLSANSGHNLGRKFTPKLLRAVRRLLVYRVFQILDQKYKASPAIKGFLNKHLASLREKRTHFIVLNWDIVLERHLEYYSDFGINYCVAASPWFGEDPPSLYEVDIVKVHGSSNWVYCDNCRSLFYDRYQKLSLIIKAGLVKADLRLFDESLKGKEYRIGIETGPRDRCCRKCQCAVSPHIATFSFRKSFRTHAFASTWLAAARILADAKKWIFIGYSLPDADYEFKHLLKFSHLMFAKGREPTKQIDVVLLKDKKAEEKFKSLFGANTISFCQGGLQRYDGGIIENGA